MALTRSGSDVSDAGSDADAANEFSKMKGKRRGGGVHFGSVRVRTHNMTLGDNPGGTMSGPPLTLEWDPADSTRFSNVEDFAVKYHGEATAEDTHRPAHRLDFRLRQQIAAQGHSAGSIRRVQKEIFDIRDERKKSSKEDPSIAEKQNLTHKSQRGNGGFLQRLFKSS